MQKKCYFCEYDRGPLIEQSEICNTCHRSDKFQVKKRMSPRESYEYEMFRKEEIGMTPKRYAELLEYVAANNCWGPRMYENQVERRRRCFKYVDASFDSRDGHIWKITFREYGGEKGMVFGIESESDIEKIYAFLNEEI